MLHDGVRSAPRCVLRDCVVAGRAKIGAHAEISDGAVIGEDAEIGGAERDHRGARIARGSVPGGAIGVLMDALDRAAIDALDRST